MPNQHDAILQTLQENRAELSAREGYSEDDTIRLLITPFLEYLGHPAAHRRSEHEVNRNRPDEIIYDRPVSRAGNLPCRIILEAKPLGTEFDRGPSRTETPARQAKRYLRDHPASGPSTYGILTDGNKYRVSRRTGHGEDIRHIGEWNILDGPALDGSDPITAVARLIHLDAVNAALEPDRPIEQSQTLATRTLVNAIADGDSPTKILDLLTKSRQQQRIIGTELALTGRALDAARDDWENHAWRYGIGIKSDNPDLSGNRVVVAVVKYGEPEAGAPPGLTRGDVALAARTFARATSGRTSVLIAYQSNGGGASDLARLAVHHQGHTGMTPGFDPHNPPASALRALEQARTALHSATAIPPTRLTDAVAAREIRKEFYEAVAAWTRARQNSKSSAYRQALLRHLIRTVFSWILKEDGIIPSEAFEEQFAMRYGAGDYHKTILSFLFHSRLNTPISQRTAHPTLEIATAMAAAPFLNGSLFAVHPGDDDLNISDDEYFGTDPDRPGLFTIMSRYNWTTAEHTPNESEQTIDPEMLSNLFENLVAATEFWTTNPERMPRGTYYTPADVATEMVKDALTAAVQRQAPACLTDAHLRDLFGNPEPDLPIMNDREIRKLRNAIAKLSIFDPAVGSGEFPFIAANAVKTALTTLGDHDESLIRRIIQEQLYALDVNPMAMQIARLRLFITIMAAERNRTETQPLPNLEGRIVCADTLATVANPEWRPAMSGGLEDTDAQIRDALMQLAQVRSRWRDAHTEVQKTEIRAQDAAARDQLMTALTQSGNDDHPELMPFARHKLLEPGSAVATDARLLFYEPDWQGFDVVIGNPPYERIAKGRPTRERNAVKKQLRERKQYQTVDGGDLYNLFCEVALTLVKQRNGVVTLIVPLSLAFRQDKRTTRMLFQQRSKEIWLCHQDNRPGTTFHESPVAHPENRQRTTIITAVMGQGKTTVHTTGTGKWRRSEREQYLLNRESTVIPQIANRPARRLHPNLAGQWPRVPMDTIADLVAQIQVQHRTIRSLAAAGDNAYAIAFPQTAYEFVTTTPSGRLRRGENRAPIADRESLELAMAALNGHVAYSWWRVWGDAFHVNDYEMTSITIPDAWLNDTDMNQKARALGRKLIDAIVPGNIKTQRSGTQGNYFENINFHEVCPDTILQLDKLHLEALGLPEEPLLAQLHTMRSNSNWRLGLADLTYRENKSAVPDNDDWQSRIVKTPGILAGKPCIRGTRISVELVDDLLRGGRSPDDIRGRYSHISLPDIEACRKYAATGAKLSNFTWGDLYGDEDDD